MKKLKKYFEYYTENPSEEMLQEFLSWVGSKIRIKIGEYLGGGVEGRIYEVDKNRAIKFTHSNIYNEQYLSSRNLPGVMKIYQTGIVEAPKRFKGGYKPNDYSYDGIWLLNPERTDGINDFKIGYVIMEKVKTSLYLKSQLEIIDYNLWRHFVKMTWVKNDKGGNDRVVELDGYHDSTKKIIEGTLDSYGHMTLKTLFSNINDKNFLEDLRKCLDDSDFEVEKREEVEHESGNYMTQRPVKYKMVGKFKKEIQNLFDSLIVCAKSIDSIGVDWGDVHSDQFGYNSKGELVAFDISFGWGKYDREDNKFVYPPHQISAMKKKEKNVIREFNRFVESK